MIARQTLAQHGAPNSPKPVDEYSNRLCHSQTPKRKFTACWFKLYAKPQLQFCPRFKRENTHA